MKWIPRENEKPEIGSKVLVYNGSVHMVIINNNGYATVIHTGINVDYYNRWTHWMPLPEPPKYDEEKTVSL